MTSPARASRHGNTERICRLQIDDQLKFRWLLHRQVGRLFTPENTACVDTGLAEGVSLPLVP
jgi:hypothetical protein